MLLRLIAVGDRMPAWVNEGFEEYEKRLPSGYRLELIEIKPAKRSANSVIDKIKQEEGEKILKHIHPSDFVVALDERGAMWDTTKLSHKLQSWYEENRTVNFFIGGADGLAPQCLQRANLTWSLSALTLPHGLVRIIVAEQLYRAWSILQGHPYHRN